MERTQKLRRVTKSVESLVTSTLLTISALMLLAMMLIMIYNVVARAAFHAPLDGVVAIVGEALMVAVVYLALASPVQISLRIVVNLLPDLMAAAIDRITWFISIAVLAVAAFGSLGSAVSSYQHHERTVGIFSFQLYPYRFLVAGGLLAAAIHVVVVGKRWVAGLDSSEESKLDIASKRVESGI